MATTVEEIAHELVDLKEREKNENNLNTKNYLNQRIIESTKTLNLLLAQQGTFLFPDLSRRISTKCRTNKHKRMHHNKAKSLSKMVVYIIIGLASFLCGREFYFRSFICFIIFCRSLHTKRMKHKGPNSCPNRQKSHTDPPEPAVLVPPHSSSSSLLSHRYSTLLF